MNSQRLLTMLLVGMLLSACAHKHYRTEILDLKSADPQPKIFECAVDDNTVKEGRKLCEDSKSAKGGRKLCEDPISATSPDCHAIQHRFYSNQAVIDSKTDKRRPLDYYLSFVEFDDQGWFADRGQMEALFALLKKLEKEDEDKQTNGHTLIYVYAHGWKHNASSCDNNVVCFSRLLERTDLAEVQVPVLRQMQTGCSTGNEMQDGFCMLQKMKTSGKEMAKKVKRRTVVGVYLGWRGLPFGGFLNNASFWSRKEAAARVGRGGVFELLTRLKDYRDIRQKAPTRGGPATQLVITGHSFGGLVVYSALSHALMERAAKTKIIDVEGCKAKDSKAKDCKKVVYDVAESFGDFVMLVNPAFQGSLYEPLFHITTNRCYERAPWRKKQRPVMMIVTSKADNATGKAFPMGQTLGTLFQHAKSSDQKQSMRKAIGHDKRYLTHALESDGVKQKPVPDPRPCPCRFLTATSDRNFGEMLGPLIDALLAKSYGEVNLTSVESPKYASSYPYLVVNTDKGVIADHNAIYNERFITFTQMFFIRHVAGSKPWTDPAPICLVPKKNTQRTKSGLVPFEQSCQLDDEGNSCSGQTQ